MFLIGLIVGMILGAALTYLVIVAVAYVAALPEIDNDDWL